MGLIHAYFLEEKNDIDYNKFSTEHKGNINYCLFIVMSVTYANS